MNAADMRGTLSVIGYHLDVVSLAKASMVCRIWNAAFGNHPRWKEFYLNSDEYLQEPLGKKGPWRVLYGQLFNKCKSLMHDKWAIERHQPGLDKTIKEFAWMLSCVGSFFVDDKLVIIAGSIFLMQKDQLKGDNMLTFVNKGYDFLINPSYRAISFPNGEDCTQVHLIRKTLLDKNYLYASVNDGQLLRWERSCFPSDCTRVIKKGLEIQDFEIRNEILYTLKSAEGESEEVRLYAYKNSEELWCLELSHGTDSEIKVNNNIGMVLEFVNEEYAQNMTPPKELYLWDARKCEKPICVGRGWHHVLIHDEVIYATKCALKARSLKGSRVICEMNYWDIDGIIPDSDLNLIYIITHRKYITTFCLSDNVVISKINPGILIPNSEDMKLFNGILYYVDDRGRLLLIDPRKGIIKKGRKKMFRNKIEVHNGRVHGLSPRREMAIIVRAVESKTILEKMNTLAEKIKKPK